MESQAPRVSVEGFDGPLDLLLELVEEKKLDILTVRLGDLADAYLARVRAMAELPADEVSAFLALASRLVLLKARSLLPSLEPIPDEEGESEEDLRLRLLEYAIVRERAGQLGARLRAGEPRAYARGDPEEHARDAVPEQCVHGFRGIVEDAGDDELLVGAELAKDARRLGRVAVVRTCGANVSRGLAHAMEHA